ncbi:MAG: kinase-like domain-containing protein [Benjaminiella poitrasii]|nr:MAG: kinase-like domain-containing protein [Benjaminiella poitrasii]
MQSINGVPVFSTDPHLEYVGLDEQPTWFSAQGGVYKCVHRTTKENVAIKKYLVEENRHEDMFVMPKELVENEIYSMTKCVHPNILKLLAVHLHDEFVYLIMPLCTGGSLQQYAFDHHLTIGQLVYIVAAIASGLAKIHTCGYIHRDIKCDNIFLNMEDNSIVIGDFGVVSISPAADSSVEEAGVVLFWSPELIQQKIVNYKIDIWALGIVILEILNGGKAPYEDEELDEEEIKQRILDNGRPEYPANIPSSLVDLLNHCLDPDPRTRPSASYVLKHPFLKEYEPELLFPGTPSRLDYDVSSQSGSDMSSIMHNDSTVSYDVVDLNTEIATMSPLPTLKMNDFCCKNAKRSSPKDIKCRLPLPSISVVDKSLSVAIPAREKIMNVIRKRQSMTDTNRSQGSRLPMLRSLHPLLEELTVEHKEPTIQQKSMNSELKLKKMNLEQKISLSEDIRNDNSNKSKNIARPNTMPTIRHKLNPLPSSTLTSIERTPNKRVSSLAADIKTNIPKPKIIVSAKIKKELLPPKDSIYRKRLPINESRTARLSMGLSANNSKPFFRNRIEQAPKKTSVLDYSEKSLHTEETTTNDSKRRPLSFASSLSKPYSSDLRMPASAKNIPPYPTLKGVVAEENSKLKRQSVPVPSKENRKHSSKKSNNNNSSKKDNNNNNSNNKEHSNIKSNSIKVLRVH